MDEEKLLLNLREQCGVTSEDSPRSCWRIWTYSVIDSARFLSSFSGLEDFQGFVESFQYNAATKTALPLYLAKKIRGMGFALACDALKELGYASYPKPDSHMRDIFSELNLCSNDEMDVFEAMVAMADSLGITPYKLDKVLWLVCSGNFYLEEVRVDGKKFELISDARNVLSTQR